MNTTTTVVLTGGVVALGTWLKGDQLGIRNFVGIGVLTVGLAAIGEVNPKLAEQFGVLILVTAVLVYGAQVGTALNSAGKTGRSGTSVPGVNEGRSGTSVTGPGDRNRKPFV